MAPVFTYSQNGDQMELAGDLKISELDNITACLTPHLNSGHPLELNMAQVGEVDTAGLQLVLAFCLTRQAGRPPRITHMPPGLNKALRLTGLDKQFQPFLA